MEKYIRRLMARPNLLLTMLLVALVMAVGLMLLDKYQREAGSGTEPATGVTSMTQEGGR